MADAVTKVFTYESATELVVRMTSISDGTGEVTANGNLKVDVSALTPAATEVRLQSVRWAMQGFSSVRLLWHATTSEVLCALSGSGYDEWEHGIKNTKATGWTGDVMLTTAGAASGATYDITAVFTKVKA